MVQNYRKTLKNSIVLAWLIAAAIVAQSAYSATLESVSIKDTLSLDHSLEETIFLSLSDNTQNSFLLTLPSEAHNVLVAGKPAIVSQGSVDVPLACAACKVNISYQLPNAVINKGETQNLYQRTLDLPLQAKLLSYEVWLPEGTSVQDQAEGPAIVPLPSVVKTDGKHIIIAWTEANPALPKNYLVRFSEEPLENPELLNELTEWPIWALVITFLIIGIAIGITWHAHYHKRHRETELPYVPASLLSPDEKIILALIKKNSGKMAQKEIGKQLNWSKSKVSAIMTALEHKQIVKREKSGRNYSVTLQKEVEL